MAADKISVIIPSFNCCAVLSKAIESIILQDYKNLQLIIIDGGSTDGTIDLLKKYHTNIDYWISEPDNGVYNAMNKGIAAAKGTWLFFLGADDELLPGVISNIFNSVSFANNDIVYGKVIIKNKGKQLGRQTDYENLIELNIPHQAIFYRKSIFEKFKGYNEKYKVLADYDLNLKIFEDQSLKKVFINTPISLFCNNGISNRTIDYSFFLEKKDYFINYNKLSPADKRLAKYHFYLGIALVLKKNTRMGAGNIFRSIIFSKNRFYYFLLTIDFILGMIGIGKKYKYV